MKRWLFAYDMVTGDPERVEDALRRDLVALLHDATGTPPEKPAVDGSLALRLRTSVVGTTMSKTVRITTSVATRSRDRLRIPISWHAEPGRLMAPSFEGSLELEPLSERRAQLTLVGSYDPPLGPLGEAADSAVMGAAARRTVQWLVQRLAAELTTAARGSHPRPSPGKDYLMHVADVMTSDPLVLDQDLPIRTAALLLFHFDVAGAPVVGDDGALLGVLSEQDLLEKEATPRRGWGPEQVRSRWRREALTVGEACTRPAKVTHPAASLQDAARAMLDHRVARLVVVDESRIVGIVSRHDVLKALVRTDEELGQVITDLLEQSGEAGVRVGVGWGEVRLEGTVSRQGALRSVVERIRMVDGVMDVDAEDLGWQTDDVAPASSLHRGGSGR